MSKEFIVRIPRYVWFFVLIVLSFLTRLLLATPQGGEEEVSRHAFQFIAQY